jgi:ABC-type sugar transport system ATPase subunit
VTIPLRDGDERPLPNADVLLGVRPESFRLGEAEGVTLSGTVKVIESLGRETLLYVDTAPLAVAQSEAQQQSYVAVHQASQQSHAPDAPIVLTVDRRDIFLFDADGRTIRFPERPASEAGH